MVTIGVLAASGVDHVEAIKQGLRDQGISEDADIKLISRVANGHLSRLPALASEIVAAEIDILVAIGAVTAKAARRAAADLPIIFSMVVDPLVDGFASTDRPTDNWTGITTFLPTQAETHVRLLGRLLPELRRVALLGDEGVSKCLANANMEAFRNAGMEVRLVEIAGPQPDLTATFAAIADFKADALVVLEHPTNGIWRSCIAKIATRDHLPTMFAWDHRNDDGLMAYGTSLRAATRQVPRLLKKVLEGASPASVPIETFQRPEFSINRRTAAMLEIALPSEFLENPLVLIA
jgi:putative tryptophan/tyrosine transport system substrate-binding protein